MADWNAPTLSTAYATLLSNLMDRDADAATLAESPTNPPTGFIRWVTASNKFQRWNGSAWVDLVLAVAGGGTGGTTALGSMAFQAAGGVAITGGTIAGITSFSFSCDLLPNVSGTRNIGSNALKIKNAYIGTGLVIPVGANKYVTS
jgi:hypothetical protein